MHRLLLLRWWWRLESILSWLTVDIVITDTMGISPISPPERQKTELIQLIKTIILFEGCFHVLAWALFFPHLIIVLSVSREARDAKWCFTVNTETNQPQSKKIMADTFLMLSVAPRRTIFTEYFEYCKTKVTSLMLGQLLLSVQNFFRTDLY